MANAAECVTQFPNDLLDWTFRHFLLVVLLLGPLPKLLVVPLCLFHE